MVKLTGASAPTWGGQRGGHRKLCKASAAGRAGLCCGAATGRRVLREGGPAGGPQCVRSPSLPRLPGCQKPPPHSPKQYDAAGRAQPPTQQPPAPNPSAAALTTPANHTPARHWLMSGRRATCRELSRVAAFHLGRRSYCRGPQPDGMGGWGGRRTGTSGIRGWEAGWVDERGGHVWPQEKGGAGRWVGGLPRRVSRRHKLGACRTDKPLPSPLAATPSSRQTPGCPPPAGCSGLRYRSTLPVELVSSSCTFTATSASPSPTRKAYCRHLQ